MGLLNFGDIANSMEHLLNTYFCKSDPYMSGLPSDLDFKAKKSKE